MARYRGLCKEGGGITARFEPAASVSVDVENRGDCPVTATLKPNLGPPVGGPAAVAPGAKTSLSQNGVVDALLACGQSDAEDDRCKFTYAIRADGHIVQKCDDYMVVISLSQKIGARVSVENLGRCRIQIKMFKGDDPTGTRTVRPGRTRSLQADLVTTINILCLGEDPEDEPDATPDAAGNDCNFRWTLEAD